MTSTRVETLSRRDLDLDSLRRVATVIRRGRVIAAPTDTIYGLLADVRNDRAIRQIFRLKRRPDHKPILLLIDRLRRLDGIVGELPDAFDELAERFWPGPLTLVVPAAPGISPSLTAGTGTIAVRLPRSPLIHDLVRLSRCPLTGTSANRSGRRGARSAREVARQLDPGPALILDGGPARRSVPSTLVDLTATPPRILRQGAIPAAALRPYGIT